MPIFCSSAVFYSKWAFRNWIGAILFLVFISPQAVPCPSELLLGPVAPKHRFAEFNPSHFQAREKSDTYLWVELTHILDPNMYIKFRVVNGTLHSAFKLKGNELSGPRMSDFQGNLLYRYRGQDAFDFVMSYANSKGVDIQRIAGDWISVSELNTNFRQFYANLSNGMTEKEAALNTWTGQQAQRYKFTEVRIENREGNQSFGKVKVTFSKPVTATQKSPVGE